MAGNLRDWLASLGLEHLTQVFEENQVGLHDLPLLSENDLKELGLALGPRRRLLNAVANLSQSNGTLAAEGQSSGEPPPAERRQLTLMFCDLVGSTALSASLDPEDLRDVMRRYQDAVAGAVTRYGGHIAKYLGDGVLAYFGWPQAYEDQADRAVRGGLDAVNAVQAVQIAVRRSLEARVGIASGQVIVGDLIGESGRDVQAVTGETPNLAARLQGIADPGQVVICAATRRLIGEAFSLRELDTQSLKGFEGELRTWCVAGEQALKSRFEAAHGKTLSRFVGRDAEVQLLVNRWDLAKDGEGQVVLISGEPGIGKSRLMQALEEEVSDQSYIRLRYQCSPHHTNSALYPFIRQLVQAASISADDSADDKFDKLEQLLNRNGENLRQTASLLAALLLLPYEERYGDLQMGPQQQKAETHEALIDLLLTQARRRPVLFLFEDAHWIDPTNQELLEQTIPRILDVPLLMLVTHRPAWQPGWTNRFGNVSSLSLGRLGRAQVLELVRSLFRESVAEPVVEEIASRTDGVPLFVEELTKAALEAGAESAAGFKVPDTVEALLLARLDRLGEAKEAAQAAAVIGRDFSYDLLSRIAEWPQTELDEALSRLVRLELVFQHGLPPDSTYTFKHALVQDTAYSSLLTPARQELHRRVASALQESAIDVESGHAEILAEHFEKAGDLEAAITYRHRAGWAAQQHSALLEATAHLARARELLAELPESDDRKRTEIKLLLDLGTSLFAVKGYGAKESLETCQRLQELYDDVGEEEQYFPVTWELFALRLFTNQMDSCRQVAEDLLDFANHTDNDGMRLQANHAAWTTKLFLGEPMAVREHTEAGIALYDPVRHRDHKYLYVGHDPGVCAQVMSSISHWITGYPDEARVRAEKAVAMARDIGHAFSHAHSLIFAADSFKLQRDAARILELGQEFRQHDDQDLFPSLRLRFEILEGWARASLGDVTEGLAAIEPALRAYRTVRQMHASQLLTFAEVALWAGRPETARDAVEEARTICDTLLDRQYEPELYRLYGESLWHGAPEATSNAEQFLLKSLAKAKEQQALGFELRTSLAIARLRAKQGERPDAYELLQPAYGRFTEGFDTPDLKEAKALLDELAW